MSRSAANNANEGYLPSSLFTQTRIKYKATPDENIEAFISQVKDYLRLQRVQDPVQQCAFFRMCLHGEAARWAELQASVTNFDDLVTQFKNYFRSLFRIASVTHVNLPTFKKGKDLTSHILKFRTAINHVYPAPSESTLVTNFIKTLGYLSPYVVQRADSTLESVIADAREHYTYKKQKAEYQLMEGVKKRKGHKSLSSPKKKKHKRRSSNSSDNSSSDSSNSSSSSSSSSENSESEEEEPSHVKYIKKQLKVLQKQVKEKMGNTITNSTDYQRNTHPAVNRNRFRPIIKSCLICGRPGHIARECYHRSKPPMQFSRQQSHFYQHPLGDYGGRTAQYRPNGYQQQNNQQISPANISQSYNRVAAQPTAKPLGVHAIGTNDRAGFDYQVPNANDINRM